MRTCRVAALIGVTKTGGFVTQINMQVMNMKMTGKTSQLWHCYFLLERDKMQ